MTKLPVVDFKTMEKVLHALDLEQVRQKGIHVFFRHPDGRTTTVPNHAGRDLAKPFIREVIREIGLSVDEFVEQLQAL